MLPRPGLLGLVALVACAPRGAARSGSPVAPDLAVERPAVPAVPAVPSIPSTPAHLAPGARPVRFQHEMPERAFWVTHGGERDRVVAAGARLELSASGEVLASAWEVELARAGEVLQGSLAVAPHLGGGFVHWTGGRVFRSTEFTGPLTPVATGSRAGGRPDVAIRGARNGLRGVLVFTDTGPRELLPDTASLGSLAEPGVLDEAALDAAHAVRLDVFGRPSATLDGGATWLDLAPWVGTSSLRLSVGVDSLGLDTRQAHYPLSRGGHLGPPEPPPAFAPAREVARGFQLAFRGTRATDRDDPFGSMSYREATPLQTAVACGASLGDGTALGLGQGIIARVELATGATREAWASWLPGNLECAPLPAPDGPLLACAWQRYQAYGAHLLRSTAAGPPVVERAFSDDGQFVTDDEGALGFVGSCHASERYVDPADWSRLNVDGASLGHTFCVRRAPGEWVEHAFEPRPQESLLAWVPQRDGGAVALVQATPVLPDGVGEARARDEGGVHVVRVYPEIPGWLWARRGFRPVVGWASLTGLDRTFHARADGSVDGWLSRGPGSALGLGVTLGSDGHPHPHELPPDTANMLLTGDRGVALSWTGELWETTDHGRSWQDGGPSPVPPPEARGECSTLGCTLGPIVRLGWAAPPEPLASTAEVSSTLVRVRPGPPPAPEEPPATPRLLCVPRGEPAPQPAPHALPLGARQTVPTPYGEPLEIVREATVPEPTRSAPSGPTAAVPSSLAPHPAPPGSRGAGPSSVPSQTHTVVFRLPFELDASPRRLPVTDPSLSAQRRRVTVLLGPTGEVSLLVVSDRDELLVSRDRIEALPFYEPRRYESAEDAAPPPGLRLEAAGRPGSTTPPAPRALLLGEVRRRFDLELHGSNTPPPTVFFGVDRDQVRRRTLTLGRRGDGALGVLVLDGAAPGTAGVAPLDALSGTVGPFVALAPWSTLRAGDDPLCRDARGAYRALVVLDPEAWLTLEGSSLPGVGLGHQGLALVRWGRERVCLEALELGVNDARRRADTALSSALVVRWSGGHPASANGALRSPALLQGLACSVAPARAPEAR